MFHLRISDSPDPTYTRCISLCQLSCKAHWNICRQGASFGFFSIFFSSNCSSLVAARLCSASTSWRFELLLHLPNRSRNSSPKCIRVQPNNITFMSTGLAQGLPSEQETAKKSPKSGHPLKKKKLILVYKDLWVGHVCGPWWALWKFMDVCRLSFCGCLVPSLMAPWNPIGPRKSLIVRRQLRGVRLHQPGSSEMNFCSDPWSSLDLQTPVDQLHYLHEPPTVEQ